MAKTWVPPVPAPWEPNKHYKSGDLIILPDGTIYMCLDSSPSQATEPYWGAQYVTEDDGYIRWSKQSTDPYVRSRLAVLDLIEEREV